MSAVVTKQTKSDAKCPGCEATITYRVLAAEGAPFFNVDPGQFLGNFADEDGNMRTVIFCSEACATKVLSEG